MDFLKEEDLVNEFKDYILPTALKSLPNPNTINRDLWKVLVPNRNWGLSLRHDDYDDFCPPMSFNETSSDPMIELEFRLRFDKVNANYYWERVKKH